MAKIFSVYVVDEDGNGLFGHTVKTYGGDPKKTDKNGKAVIATESSNVTIYINGFTGFDGATSRLEGTLYFTTTAKMLSGLKRN